MTVTHNNRLNKVLNIAGTVDSLLGRLDQECKGRNLFWWLLPTLLALLVPVSWSSGEETYFLMAYRRVAPEAFSTFHAAFDHSDARFLFEYMIGTLIKCVGYQVAQEVSRLSMVVAYACSLSILFSSLGLSVLRAVAVVAMFSIAGEQIIGNEWLFKGVESKTFASAAVLCALGFGLRQRWWLAITFVVVATYLHFLVGGFWGIGIALLVFLQTGSISASLRVLSVFLLCIFPLLIMIGVEQFAQAAITSSVTPNQIYAMRLPHHIAPFSSKSQLWIWSNGIVATVTLTIVFLVLAGRGAEKVLASFIFCLLLYLCAALVLSIFDRHALILGKLYVFRPSSIILLLGISYLLSGSRKVEFDIATVKLRLTLALFIALFLWSQVKRDVEEYLTPQALPDIASLVEAVERESIKDEIVLIEPRDGGGKDDTDVPYIGLPRHIPRPTLVSWKFVPTNPQDLIRWYDLLEFRKAVFRDGCKATLSYPVRLLLVFRPETLSSIQACGEVVWKGESGYLVRIENN